VATVTMVAIMMVVMVLTTVGWNNGGDGDGSSGEMVMTVFKT